MVEAQNESLKLLRPMDRETFDDLPLLSWVLGHG